MLFDQGMGTTGNKTGWVGPAAEWADLDLNKLILYFASNCSGNTALKIIEKRASAQPLY